MARKPKPPLAEWLVSRRKAKGLTTADVARVVDRSEATIRGWEAGRPPRADDPSIVVLERYYGAEAPSDTAPDDLVAAINRQAAALEALVAKFDGEWDHRLRKVEDALDALVEREWLVTRELDAPHERAGSGRARA